ncbi:SH3-like domain-containing protein [Paroceanicella profunda]|nr:SH3-like domain-containing protein [Paroceanicella profunda]
MSTDPEKTLRYHDMGGLEAGPVDLSEHDYALWEKRVDALMVLSTSRGLFTVDGLRRAIEDMGPDAYETMSYYERWIYSVNRNLIEAGAYTADELAARLQAVAARGADYATCSLAEPGDA